MRKLIAAALIIPSACAAFYLFCAAQPEGRGLWAPNVLYRVQIPCWPICDTVNPQVAKVLHEDVPVNGKRIVKRDVDPERYDMASAMAREEKKWRRGLVEIKN